MVDMKQVTKDIAAKCAEIDACNKQVEDAKASGDEQKMKDASTNITQLNVELAELESKMDVAKGEKRRKDLLAEAQRLSAPVAPVAPARVDVPSSPAMAKDHNDEESVKREAFCDYLRGDAISDSRRNLLVPKSEKLRSSKKKRDGAIVAVPASLASAMVGGTLSKAMGLDRMAGKAMLATADAVNNPSLMNFLLNNQYVSQMQQLPMPEPVILPRVSIVPTTSGTATIFPALAQTDTTNLSGDFGGVSFSWIDEAHEKPSTEPEFTQITITAYECAGYTEVSQRALNRSEIGLEAYLRYLFSGAYQSMLDRVILNGTGVGQPTGIIGAAGIRTVARQTAGAVSYQDTVRLKHAVRSYHRSGARYTMSDAAKEAFEEVVDTLGHPIFKPSVASGPNDRINGYPYDATYHCSALGTAGDVIYGNPAWYTLTVEEEFGIARSEHFKFREDLVAFRVYAIVGGLPMHPRAFAILSDAES